MVARNPAGVWAPPRPQSPPPTDAELWVDLVRDYGPMGWEITLPRPSLWLAVHPSVGRFTHSSPIGLRAQLDAAHLPR